MLEREQLARLGVTISLALGLVACDQLATGNKAAEIDDTAVPEKATVARNRICASNATYARLKTAAFDEAKRIRESDTAQLDALADASVVRMENPLLQSRDEALDLTTCSGRMVLELPPGAGAAFGGRQRLTADITYSAQGTADGSGAVYDFDGGEPIVYQLASFNVRRGGTEAATEYADARAAQSPIAPAEPELEPVPVPTPEPQLPVSEEPVRRVASAPPTPSPPPPPLSQRRVQREGPVERRVRRGSPQATARPSFNCRYARSRVERSICRSEDLAARDREMAQVFNRANDRVDDVARRQLEASRLRFLAARDRCRTEACVAERYDERVIEIQDIEAESE